LTATVQFCVGRGVVVTLPLPLFAHAAAAVFVFLFYILCALPCFIDEVLL